MAFVARCIEEQFLLTTAWSTKKAGLRRASRPFPTNKWHKFSLDGDDWDDMISATARSENILVQCIKKVKYRKQAEYPARLRSLCRRGYESIAGVRRSPCDMWVDAVDPFASNVSFHQTCYFLEALISLNSTLFKVTSSPSATQSKGYN